MKKCTKCGIEKEESEFNKCSRNKTGFRPDCRDCQKQHWHDNKEDYQRNAKSYYQEHKAHIKARAKEYNKTNRDKRVITTACRRYGVTKEEYKKLLETQKECCAICGAHKSTLSKGLCVDHDHETGKIRKLLCSKCNAALGLFQDSPELLRIAANYLDEMKRTA